MNYETIKQLAKQAGRKVTDYLALAPQNDPFYTGTETNKAQGAWFAAIWDHAGYSSRVHLRRVHYWVVSQGDYRMHTGEVYENTEKCWDYLGQASKMARYLGLVRIEDIQDNKNPKPHVHALYSSGDPSYQINIPDLDDPFVWVSGITDANAQPYHLEIWVEKSTMNDVLMPVCEAYGANLVTFEGEVSVTACYELTRRIEEADGKPTRIFYVSDFDPAGKSIPAAMSRKVEYMLARYGCDYDVRIKPLLLTEDQVRRYRLPRVPIKESEKRAEKFEQAFGSGATELDALEALRPGELARLLTVELKRYYSQNARQLVRAREAALRQAVTSKIAVVTEKYAEEIEALREMIEELRAIQVDASEFAVDRFDPHVQETDDWLFDSSREYIEQLAYYKAHKGQEAA